MAYKLQIAQNATNAAVGDIPARSIVIQAVYEDDGTIAPIGDCGRIVLSLGEGSAGGPTVVGGTQGSDGINHEIKLREVDICVMVDDVPTTRRIIGLLSDVFDPA